jgi:hypothetical protein
LRNLFNRRGSADKAEDTAKPATEPAPAKPDVVPTSGATKKDDAVPPSASSKKDDAVTPAGVGDSDDTSSAPKRKSLLDRLRQRMGSGQ